MKTVGLIGCGAMGKGMATSLLSAGYSVYIYDDMSKWREPLEKQGACFVENSAAVAKKAKYVLLSLPSPNIVAETVAGKEGLLCHLQTGGFLLDLSTTDVQTTLAMEKAAAAKGIHYLDCPVSGGPAGADAGTLTIMVGGDKHAYFSVKPLLDILGDTILYVGDSGAGQTVKLCNNMLVAGITTLLSETMAVASDHGVSRRLLAEIIQQSSGHNRVLDVFGENLISGSYDNVLFYLKHMAKDLELYMALSQDSRKPQHAAGTVNQLYRSALHQGKGDKDATAVY